VADDCKKRFVEQNKKEAYGGKSQDNNCMSDWQIFPFNNYFGFSDRMYSDDEMWDISKAAGFDKFYYSFDRSRADASATASRIGRQRRRTGLGLGALYTVVRMHQPVPEGGKSVVDAMDYLEAGDTLELALMLEWNQDRSDPKHDPMAIDLLEGWLDEAKKRDLQISLYHHFGFWMERFDDCLRLAKQIDDPRLGVTFCGYHWFAVDGVGLDEKFDKAADYLKIVNVSGSRYAPETKQMPNGYTVEPVGHGDFPLDDVIQAMRRVGYQRDVGFQGYKVGGDPEANLAESMKNWRVAVAK